MLLDFTMTAQSNSLSKTQKQQPSVRLKSNIDTMKMQTLAYFIFMFLPLFPAECCCGFSLTSPNLDQVFVFAVLSRLTHRLPWSGCFSSLWERLFSLCIFRHFVQTWNWLCCKKTGRLQTKQSSWCWFLFTMGLTVLYNEGTNCSDAFWKPDLLNKWITLSAVLLIHQT